MMRNVIWMSCLWGLALTPVCAAEPRPAVLFSGVVHSEYVVRPLADLGIAVDTCQPEELATRLASGQYNVAVVARMSAAQRQAVAAFLKRGGGVFVTNPDSYPDSGALAADFTATAKWLAERGARLRWETLVETETSNIVTDSLRSTLSFSDQVMSPVNVGVRGILVHSVISTVGWQPPMSFDFSPDWTVVVRGARTMQAVPDQTQNPLFQEWIPATTVEASPALMGVRALGKGRLALVGIPYEWVFAPPPNCPTSEEMLSTGFGGKPSHWLRVFANTFRWLAAPSLQAGMGGATTPAELINPPLVIWEPQPPLDWSQTKPLAETPNWPHQAGLIGARTVLSSGTGTVAEYADAARKAGLQFIVFLEDSLRMAAPKWDQLVKQCAAASDASFLAVPGLTYEDAQGNHLYAFSDDVGFPKSEMLLPDGRLATTGTMRSRAYFDFINEMIRQRAITGFWRHKENYLPYIDYKLYNSFPIVTTENGKTVDDALDEYLYLQGIGGCQAALAFEMMTSPDQVAARARDGWRVVSHRATVSDLRTNWHHGAWSFCGSGSQYITQGPRIEYWDAPNRMTESRGEWWRPDLWQFRVRLRVASDAGLKSVTLHDGDRGVMRRWLPGGAQRFEQEIVLANAQQLGATLVVEDMNGKRAVSMSFWNRNLLLEEFICSDRCNFLGNGRHRNYEGEQTWITTGFIGNMGITPSKGRLQMQVRPAMGLTPDEPTLPIDGRPVGHPCVDLNFDPRVPGEAPHLFAYPQTYLVGPEIAIGQADLTLSYDPAEQGATKSPLGHAYTQPQDGSGNSWGSWHKLISTRRMDGFARNYGANRIPGKSRLGWHEADYKLKAPVQLTATNPVVVMTHTSMGGWTIYRGATAIASVASGASTGVFERGMFAILPHPGGDTLVAPLEGPLKYIYRGDGNFSLHYDTPHTTLPQGERIRYQVGFAGAAGTESPAQLLALAKALGISTPGQVAYSPKLKRGQSIDTCLYWRVAPERGAIEATLPRTDLNAFLTVSVEGLNDNWSVWLLDHDRKTPNYRSLPIRDGRSFAQLDLHQQGADVFIGHPVTCDRDEVHVTVSWKQPGIWYIEAHNPGDKPAKVRLRSNEGWTPFQWEQEVELPAGASIVWDVKEKP